MGERKESAELECSIGDDAEKDSLFGEAPRGRPRVDRAGDSAIQRMINHEEPFPRGTEVWVKRKLGYHHSGVYVGGGKVVHLHGEPLPYLRDLAHGDVRLPVVCTDLLAFSHGEEVSYGPSRAAFPASVICARAMSAVGEMQRYNPVMANCQHFSSFVVTGTRHSPEVELFQKLSEHLAESGKSMAKNLVP